MSDLNEGIIEAICSYVSKEPVRMHMPGHKGRKAFSADPSSAPPSPEWAAGLLDQLRALDMTESPGLDNLHYPTGCIRNAEARAERVFGSGRTYFLVNGATSGIQASLLSVRMTLGSGSILLPRNVHKSLVSAMVMSGLEPIFVWPEYNPRLGGYLPLDTARVAEALDSAAAKGQTPKAVFLINPTYTGFARNLTGTAALVHERGMAFLVDEAHGSHFSVGENLPLPALKAGADLVTHGTHKTTVAFTQTALLHVGTGAITRFPGLLDNVEEALRAVMTTSPSYILMTSIEQAIRVLEKDGGKWANQGTKVAIELASRLSRIPGLTAAPNTGAEGLPGDLQHDPTKLLVNLDGLGCTGPEAVKFLVQECGVVPELTGPHYLLMLVSGAHDESDVEAVEVAFRRLAERFPRQPGTSASVSASAIGTGAGSLTEMPHPEKCMSLREAFLSVSRPVPVEKAEGRISADTVVIYPPGSPLVTPGERIDRDVVEYILRAKSAGLNVLGRGIRAGEGELKVYCVESL